MRCRTFEQAKEQAQANADATAAPWVAFFDTSGNARAERFRGEDYGGTVFEPIRYCEFCGDGPTCIVCERGMNPDEAVELVLSK